MIGAAQFGIDAYIGGALWGAKSNVQKNFGRDFPQSRDSHKKNNSQGEISEVSSLEKRIWMEITQCMNRIGQR